MPAISSTQASLTEIITDYLVILLKIGMFDILIAGLLTLPSFLLLSIPSLIVPIELGARYLRTAYILKLSLVIGLINAFYYLYLTSPSEEITLNLYNLAEVSSAIFANQHWIDWMNAIAIVLLPASFTWFIAGRWINKKAYVITQRQGRYKTLMPVMEFLFLSLIMLTYVLCMIFAYHYLSTTKFELHNINSSFLNPIGILLYNAITYICPPF